MNEHLPDVELGLVRVVPCPFGCREWTNFVSDEHDRFVTACCNRPLDVDIVDRVIVGTLRLVTSPCPN